MKHSLKFIFTPVYRNTKVLRNAGTKGNENKSPADNADVRRHCRDKSALISETCLPVGKVCGNYFQMKKIIAAAAIALFTNAVFTQNKYWFTQPGYTHFSMPSGVNENNYLPKKVIFAMKEQYRSNCRVSGVDGIARLNDYLAKVGAVSTEKMFPYHEKPATERNAQGIKLADLSLVYSLEYTSDVKLEKVINYLLSLGCFEYVQPWYVPEICLTPNDTSIVLQNHLAIINAFNAWGVNNGNASVVIGITDTGIEYTHSDLGNIAFNTLDGPAVNGIDDDADGYIDNYQGWDVAMDDRDATLEGNAHGVHVTGLAAATTDNVNGVAGVGWNCKYLPVKIANSSGFLTAAYQGIIYAADHGCTIINCSWGSPGTAGPLEQSIIDYATINKGCLVVAAAGNNGNSSPFFPAALDHVLSVAATDDSDVKFGFSSYGNTIDVCAPGLDYSTWEGNSYLLTSGTSMASPIVAGAAAIVKSFFPTYTALQVAERLKVTCDDIYPLNPGYINQLGNGRINLFRALIDPAVPSVVNTARTFFDNNDNAFVVGDTLRISGDHTDYLAPAIGCTAKLSSTSPYVTMLDSATSLGNIGTLATVNNNADPFTVKILAGAPINTNVTFQLTYTAGTYTQSYWFDVTINVDYINIDINDVATTITSKGGIGYNLDVQQQGLGFVYLGTTNLMYESSMMIGASATQVSDMFRGSGGDDEDNVSTTNTYKVLPGTISDMDVYGIFNDNASPSPIGVTTHHKAWAWVTPGNRKFVIVEYVIKNTSGSPISNLYSGIITDWDVMDYTLNKVSEDVALKMGYIYSTEASGLYAGVKLLTPTPFLNYGVDNIAGGGGGVDLSDGFSTSEKYTVLSTNRPTAGGVGGGNDVFDCVSSGPFTIAVGDSIKVAFAILAGDTLTDLQTSAVNAQIRYNAVTGISAGDNSLGEFSLEQNYPNPVNKNSTLIEFTLAEQSNVELNVYDVLGNKTGTIASAKLPQGTHAYNYDVSKLSNGIYFYQLKANGKSIARKMIIKK